MAHTIELTHCHLTYCENKGSMLYLVLLYDETAGALLLPGKVQISSGAGQAADGFLF